MSTSDYHAVCSIKQYKQFLTEAEPVATALMLAVANIKQQRRPLYEASVVAIHRILLSPVLRNGEHLSLRHDAFPTGMKDALTVADVLKRGIPKQFKSEALRTTPSALYVRNCVKTAAVSIFSPAPFVAIGVNFRESRVANARVSSYGMDVSLPCKLLLKKGHTITEGLLREHGGRFFTESIDLYFAVFGRGNTLNERLLDHAPTWSAAETITLRFVPDPVIENGVTGPAAIQFTEQIANGRIISATITVAKELWSVLIKDANGDLGADYLSEAWRCYADLVVNPQVADGSVVNTDWPPVAGEVISRTIGRRLWSARSVAESVVLRYPGAIAKHLDTIYPEDDLSTVEKLSRLLTLIQGSVCLVPWAVARDVSLPVVTIPSVDALERFRCGWTVIPAVTEFDPSSLVGIKDIVSRLFSAAVGESPPAQDNYDEHFRATLEGLCTNPLVDHETELRDAVLPFQKRFLDLIDAAKYLTGDKHEGRETSYRLIYGAPEVLKHIERVISNEIGTRKGEDTDTAKALAITCRGHYSVFQQDGFAAFVDQFYGKLTINKIVTTRVPPENELVVMRNQGDIVVDDKFRDLRWLTYKLQPGMDGATAILVAGGDGILRVFIRGKQLLTWKKYASPEDRCRWKLGLEFGDRQDSPLARLSKEIQEAMGFGVERQTQPCVRDLVSSICTISETPGEGALFIIGGMPWQDKSLCDMVPDDFKMDWALDRQLDGLEQRVLRSLAVMDGAIHVAADQTQSTHWVCARRYIAAAPMGRNGQTLTAGVLIKQYFDRWMTNLKAGNAQGCGDGHNGEIDSLKKWSDRLGSKGTRHRSVFQLCCLWDQHFSRFVDNRSPLICSISADGPVHLYQVRVCRKCNKRFLWTDEAIS
jgi:hypothetical protein